MRRHGDRQSARRAGAALAVALSVGVLGCAAPPASRLPSHVLPNASSPPPSIDIPGVDPPDEALVDKLQAEGMSEGAALFFAMTRVDGEPVGDLGYRIVEAFPTGNTATLTITLTPGQGGEPGVLEVAHDRAGANATFTIGYLVGWESVPDDVERGLRDGEDTSPGLGVVVEGVVEPMESAVRDRLLEYLDARLGARAAEDRLYSALESELPMTDALATGAAYDVPTRQIDRLEACVQDPANPAVARAYAADPASRQRIIERIAAVRAEVAANVTVGYLGLPALIDPMLQDVPWLRHVLGPGTAWSQATLRSRHNRLVDDLDRLIPSCDGFQFEFSGGGPGILAGEPLEGTWHYWGVLCPGDADWKVWEKYQTTGIVKYDIDTGRPGAAPLGPIVVTFDRNGEATASTWNKQDFKGLSLAETKFSVAPPLDPTEITALVPVGATQFTVKQRIDKLDYSFGDCP